ncbi:hypothetical protein HMPREF0201_03294 [Cedecea davisae DSM 4568]|uniref:Uncharacterized protein n=1 Tax=Cedecea davisae DSM 4568 TaxID=566551 RepID=S3IRG4_9ENTR|nr:hypothetical protein HMPREF0201_03294 [Cedecea davisae DSM 4568]
MGLLNRFNDLVDIRFSRHNGYGSAKRFWRLFRGSQASGASFHQRWR